MKTGIFIIVIFTALVSCSSSQADNKAISADNDLTDKSLTVESPPAENIGPVLFTIDFQLKASGEDLETFDDGFIPWISIDNPTAALKDLVDADKIVLPFPNARIIIDYPLNTPATFEISTTGKGFSRKQLILEISERYHEIYTLEESTATTKTIPTDKRKGLINRNRTDGKFGVWGHDLSDLDLSEIEVHQNSLGQITLTLGVES